MIAGEAAPAVSAGEAALAIRDGRLGAEAYAQALLSCVDAREAQLQAWAWLDREQALAQARAADAARRQGRLVGPLAGVPVGVKDIIDVQGQPTGDGTVLHAGRVATRDAAAVARLRAAGGWPMGKTVTTELATYAAGKTRNPHHSDYSPGGSSSGSAAAVAAGMVPLAIGTQTNGSIIRPAAFCGVVGYKPSAGRIGRSGVLVQSPPLDQLGVFARSVEDAALLVDALSGHDEGDSASSPLPWAPLSPFVNVEPPMAPRLAWMPTPWWTRMAPDARQAFAGLLDRLGEHQFAGAWPEPAGTALSAHRTVMEADIAGSFESEYEHGRAHLSASLVAQIERGRLVSAVDYRKALALAPALQAAFEPLWTHCDAILTPATLGVAPLFSEGTGDPLMCTLWTFCGMPTLSLPLLRGAAGLPLGVQLVAARGDDARLLRTARWLMRHFP